jgi:thiaminase
MRAGYVRHSLERLSVELWASAAAMCCSVSSPMKLRQRLYAHVCVRRAIQPTCVAHDARSHTYNRERGHIHPCIRAHQHTKYKHTCIDYVLHSLECLERGVVGKCCSNVLRSFIAYEVSLKAVRTCVCEKSDTAHVRSSRGHIHPCIRARQHTKYKHTCIDYVLHLRECLERGVVGKCCSNVLYSVIAYGVVTKAVRTCVCEKSDRAHVRSSRCAISHIQPRARSYTPMHTCMPTYLTQAHVHTYLHSSAQRNSIYHA